MNQRIPITITMRPDIHKKLRALQAKEIITNSSSKSLSSVIDDVLRKALK